nr:YvrJ family protein [Anaerococcus mediterraneensis]
MDIVELISQVGFPIVMNLILIVQINGKLDQILDEMKK